jgi:hypothetical protein
MTTIAAALTELDAALDMLQNARTALADSQRRLEAALTERDTWRAAAEARK